MTDPTQTDARIHISIRILINAHHSAMIAEDFATAEMIEEAIVAAFLELQEDLLK